MGDEVVEGEVVRDKVVRDKVVRDKVGAEEVSKTRTKPHLESMTRDKRNHLEVLKLLLNLRLRDAQNSASPTARRPVHDGDASAEELPLIAVQYLAADLDGREVLAEHEEQAATDDLVVGQEVRQQVGAELLEGVEDGDGVLAAMVHDLLCALREDDRHGPSCYTSG